jgi:hypothetical protein
MLAMIARHSSHHPRILVLQLHPRCGVLWNCCGHLPVVAPDNQTESKFGGVRDATCVTSALVIQVLRGACGKWLGQRREPRLSPEFIGLLVVLHERSELGLLLSA